jgi:hypothetical protein
MINSSTLNLLLELTDMPDLPSTNLTKHALNDPKACNECCDVDAPKIGRKRPAEIG